MEQSYVSALKSGCMLWKKVFSFQKWCLGLYICLLFVTGSTQQIDVELLPFNNRSTGCNDGSVIDGKDPVVMTGFVTSDGSLAIEFLKRRVGELFYTPDCRINVTADGCNGVSTAFCYCQNKIGNNHSVVYNRIADIRDKSASLALRYGSTTSEQLLPIVNYAEDIRVTVTRATGTKVGSNISLAAGCPAVLGGETYDFTICATNLDGVSFSITTDASVRNWTAAINDCSSISNVILPGTGSLIFAYNETNGCQRNENFSCALGGKDDDGGDCDWWCILLIILGILLAIGLPLVWFLFWKYYPDERVLCCCKKTSICCCDRKTVCCFKKTPADCCMTSKTEPKDDGPKNGNKEGPTAARKENVPTYDEQLKALTRENTSMTPVTLGKPVEHGAITQMKTAKSQPKNANGQDSSGKEGSVENNQVRSTQM